MGNINWHQLEAGNIVKNLSSYFSHASNFSPLNIGVTINSLIILVIFTSLLIIIRIAYSLYRSITDESTLLELTPPAFTDKSAFTTEQLFTVIHGIRNNRSIKDKIIGNKPRISFEIVSTHDAGIKYCVRLSKRYVHNFKRNILSYLPQIQVNEVSDYLTKNINKETTQVAEFKLARHYAYPLQKQQFLDLHDPVAYITGMMTQLSPGELIAFQIVVAPIQTKEARLIKHMIHRNDNVLSYLDRFQIPALIKPFEYIFKLVFKTIKSIGNNAQWAVSEVMHPATQPIYADQHYQYQNTQIEQNIKPVRTLTRFEQETILSIEDKIDKPLFESSIRLLVQVNNSKDRQERINGFVSSLGNYNVSGYQSIIKSKFPPDLVWRSIKHFSFTNRLLSFSGRNDKSLLSSSEIADLYHFPFKGVTQTENIVKVYAKELPAPLSLKKGIHLDVIFGKNTYGGVATDIGLTEEQRLTHTYILGRTGAGKTTLMFTMAKHDIEEGRGVGFIDPHGDVSEDLINSISLSRKDDLVYINPFDIKHPVGINVLELTEGLDEDEQELEKEVVCEGVISLFKKVFSREENANAHRIEHILRNTIYTAFYAENRTLFTINTLLTDDVFRKKIVSRIDDEDLLNFWKSEFGKAGDFQVVKMTQGVTAKVGRFLRSPTARRMLEQTKSTISFDDILNGKILICNLSQGKLGEDTTKLIGTTILTKLQQAALKRALVSQKERKPFYLYIDEFQNFATFSFIKIVSEGRKYGLHLIMGEQSTSQQQDRSIVNQILANVTTVIVFRTGNYVDEDLMLNQFSPYLQKGDIPNLSRYHFYIKNSALDSEEPFSGETLFTPINRNIDKMNILIEASRKNCAIVYVRKIKNSKTNVVHKQEDQIMEKKTGLPRLKKV